MNLGRRIHLKHGIRLQGSENPCCLKQLYQALATAHLARDRLDRGRVVPKLRGPQVVRVLHALCRHAGLDGRHLRAGEGEAARRSATMAEGLAHRQRA